MQIKTIEIKNFRLLKSAKLDLKDKTSLLVGKNNSGKTSFLVLFEKFYENESFNINDFSLPLRAEIKSLTDSSKLDDLSIRMILEISYEDKDDLKDLSQFILDLDPKTNVVNILFECSISPKFISELAQIETKDRDRFAEKNLSRFLQKSVYAFAKPSDLEPANRKNLVKKKIEDIRELVNFQILHAKRDVASSEVKSGSRKVLSSLTTKYFNSKNQSDLKGITELLIEMDKNLEKPYEDFFGSFLDNAKSFLNLNNLKVTSNLESKVLLEASSQVVYGENDSFLPENLNGLGVMNVLYLLLSIEIYKDNFLNAKKPINLFYIEEPEAHTHPQMQYIFAKKIKEVLAKVPQLQTVITTHSSHIVSQCDFDDLRYIAKTNEEISIKNFAEDLKCKYKDADDFKFLKEYLTIQSAELFFADKVIFIEGVSERILLPYFISQVASGKDGLDSQNVSILEVGANSRVFQTFLDFLGIKTLIITDMDAVNGDGEKCQVSEGVSISNYSLKHYLNAPEGKEKEKFSEWYKNLLLGTSASGSKNVSLAYQLKEANYHARSFEDAFISINIEQIKACKKDIWGLKNVKQIETETNFFKLTESIIDKKSDFAASILYLALSKGVKWKTPSYIEKGFEWLAK